MDPKQEKSPNLIKANDKSEPHYNNKLTGLSAKLAHVRFVLAMVATLVACLMAGDLWGSESPAMDGIDGHLWYCDFIPVKQGGAYVYGTYTDNLRFGDQVLTAHNKVGGFLARMDKNGRWLWARQFEGDSPLTLMDSRLSVSELPNGNLNLVAFHMPEPRSGQLAEYRKGEIVVTLSTITPAGTVAFSKKLMGAHRITDWSLDYFSSGELLLVADVEGYRPAADPAQAGKDGVFIGKFSSGGDLIWENLMALDSSTGDEIYLWLWGSKTSSAGNVYLRYSVTKHLREYDTQRTEYLIGLNAYGEKIFSASSLHNLTFVSDDGQYIVYEETRYLETTKKTLYKMDMQGKLVDSWLSPIVENRSYWRGNITDENGRVYSYSGETVSCRGPDGSFTWELEILSDGFSEIIDMIRTSRGNLIIRGRYRVNAHFGNLRPLNKSIDECSDSPFIAMITRDGYWAWAVDPPHHPTGEDTYYYYGELLELGDGHILYTYDGSPGDRREEDTGFHYCRMLVFNEAGKVLNDALLGNMAGAYGGANGLIGDGRGGFVFYQSGYARGFFDKSGKLVQSEHPQLLRLDPNGNVLAQAKLQVHADCELEALKLMENGNVLIAQCNGEYRPGQFWTGYHAEETGENKNMLSYYSRDLTKIWEREIEGIWMPSWKFWVEGNKMYGEGDYRGAVNWGGRALTGENDEGHLTMEINSSGNLVSNSMVPRISQQWEGYDLYNCGEWSDSLSVYGKAVVLGEGNYYVAGVNPKGKVTWIHRFIYDGKADMITDGAGNVYVTGILNNEGITIDDFSVSDYSGTDHIFLAIFGPDGECRKLKKFDHPNTTKKEVTLTMEEFVLSGDVIYITARKKIDFDFVTYESVPNTELLIIAYDVENAQTRSNFIEIENSFDSAYCTVLADDLGNVYLAEYIALDPRYDIESGNLIKLDRSLYEVWRKKIFVDSIVTGNRGHVLVLGNIDKCAEVDGHVLIGYGQYLAKINPEGVVEWAYRCEDFPLQGHGGASMPTSGNGR